MYDVQRAWEMAQALAEIKADRLWEGQYDNWTKYVEERWSISPGWGNEMIEAYAVRRQLESRFQASLAPATIRL